ncbi:MAG: hypothetical protein AB7O62_06150 [Pirellulales bacterium]
MARKIVNRKELRDEADAAERIAKDKPAKAKAKTKTTKAKSAKSADGTVKKPVRKSRAKAAKEVRLKAFWGVFNQSMKRVALFEYSQKADADKKASELSTSQKTPHFVQTVKEPIEE